MKKNTTKSTEINAEVFYIPLNSHGYLIPAEATLSGRPEVYINSHLSAKERKAVIAKLEPTIIAAILPDFMKFDWFESKAPQSRRQQIIDTIRNGVFGDNLRKDGLAETVIAQYEAARQRLEVIYG